MYGMTDSLPQQAHWDVFRGDYWGTMRLRSYESVRADRMHNWRGYGAWGASTVAGLYATTAVAKVAAGALSGGKLGAAAGPIGIAIGLVAGAAAGIAAHYLGGHAGAGVAHGYTWLGDVLSPFDRRADSQFTTPFVNTRMASTMRQAGMQSMMNSAAQYRSVLEREAGIMHR